jgi:hypothetical protein
MPHERYELRHVSDETLLDRLRCIIKQDRALTAKLLAYMAEVDARSLYADEAMPSMFRFCTERLGMAEGQAYLRIAACRAARKFPKILELIARGQIHVTGVKLLAPHLTQENHEDLLEAAQGRTVRAIEHLLAERFPQPDAKTTIRKLPERPPLVVDVPPAPQPNAPSLVGRVTPTRVERDDSEQGAPDGERSAVPKSRYKVQFAADRSFVDKLERAKGLLRHKVPDGRLEMVLEEALDVLLLSLEKKKFKTTDRPRKTKGARAHGTGNRKASPRDTRLKTSACHGAAWIDGRVWHRGGWPAQVAPGKSGTPKSRAGSGPPDEARPWSASRPLPRRKQTARRPQPDASELAPTACPYTCPRRPRARPR